MLTPFTSPIGPDPAPDWRDEPRREPHPVDRWPVLAGYRAGALANISHYLLDDIGVVLAQAVNEVANAPASTHSAARIASRLGVVAARLAGVADYAARAAANDTPERDWADVWRGPFHRLTSSDDGGAQ